ncbi:37S ribosomal protein S9 [Cordyceps fumosorosea ARSEF 2679]|uniref:37S ribosomal protein S9 n=1 Tax=Cordyceps fumosorosea (strain ARSEF 2679) TaxID=1081104 RepID=A0A162LJV4_CORFA|nr:37S ribosomal protein S9 [Cordyceps fumosorosea ARSEF 2679]OAA71594.1 37S ribosomal protein S9 [Cordyceps fumosorosea ARSEF 2679]
MAVRGHEASCALNTPSDQPQGSARGDPHPARRRDARARRALDAVVLFADAAVQRPAHPAVPAAGATQPPAHRGPRRGGANAVAPPRGDAAGARRVDQGIALLAGDARGAAAALHRAVARAGRGDGGRRALHPARQRAAQRGAAADRGPARAFVVEGTGEVLVNGKTLGEAFGRVHDRESAIWALLATGRLDKYNVWALVEGGGTTGQAEAMTMAVAKGLLAHEPALKPALRKAGCITRDPRKVERKLHGHVKARKSPAWVKR